MPETPAILETALYADDLQAAEDFYGGVMGLEVVARLEGRHVFFRCGGGMLLVFHPITARFARKDAPAGHLAHGALGRGHMCFAASRAQIAEWKRHFRELGIAIEAEVTWPGGARSLYLRDPAENSIEFAEPRLWGFEAAKRPATAG